MKTRIFVTVLLFLGLISISNSTARAETQVTITDLSTLGGSNSYVLDINDLGQAVGYSEIQLGYLYTHAFIWQNGQMTDLGTLGGYFTYASAINELEQIVGYGSTDGGVNWSAVIWQNGTMTHLGTLGGYDSHAIDINELGQVAGYSTTTSGDTHAFIWENGAMTDLGTLGGNHSVSYFINNNGQVVGQSYTSTGAFHSFIWENGIMTDLGTLGGAETWANSINDRGQIVGSSLTESGYWHAFIWEKGTMTDLGTLGGDYSYAQDINEFSQVVGYSYTTLGYPPHAFLWENGIMTDLGTLSGFSAAVDINNRGQIVGRSRDASGNMRSVFWQNGVMLELGNLGGDWSEAKAINELGQVVGSSNFIWTTPGEHATLWTLTQINSSPIADAGGPYTAYKGETITLDASNSYDPEGGLLTYEWDLNNDGSYNDATGITTDISFANTGNYIVSLRVTDTGGLSNTDTADINILQRLNDNFTDATIIPLLPFDDAVDITGATLEVGEPSSECASYGSLWKTVWYAYTPLTNEAVSASIPAATFAPVLAVYTGDSLTNLTQLSCRVFWGNELTFLANAGTTYYFQVGKYTSWDTDGDVQFHLEKLPNLPPKAIIANYRNKPEGSLIQLNAFFSSDPNGDPLTYEWDLDYDGQYDDATGVTAEVVFGDNGGFPVGLRVTDDSGLSGTDKRIVGVFNVEPFVETITAPIEPIEINTEVYVTASFSDPGFLDTHTAVWDWGNGTSSEGVGDGYTISGTQIYDTPGVYTLTLTVTDDDGGVGTATFQYVVVYDPNGGFVTGSGWINSPEGAYTPDPTLTGKATFGFVSKYQKGANVPTGVTGFRFNVADFYFESTSYDWLVIAGGKAQYKGTGTINGTGEYKFMLTAIDGIPDLFRIKIWDKETGAIIYDNMLGEADNVEPYIEIGGGAIVIHKPK